MIRIKLLENKMFKIKMSSFLPRIVLANMQEKKVIPAKEIQEILPDKNFDGLSKVIVNKIPDEYIIPDGNLEINQNGTFDVANKANAIVNVPEKKLGTKTITINGTYKATDDNLDGYNEVEVTTSGVDINDYFTETINGTSDTTQSGWGNTIKKLPKYTFNGTTAQRLFAGYNGESIDLSNFDTSNTTNMAAMFNDCHSLISLDLSKFNTSKTTSVNGMFYGCTKLTSVNFGNNDFQKVTDANNMFRRCKSIVNLDLSNFVGTNISYMNLAFGECSSLETINLSNFANTKQVSVSQMFYNCIALNNINMSSFDFTKTISYTNMLQNVPKDCYILVKDETQKNWFTTYQSRMTNVHYVGEEG